MSRKKRKREKIMKVKIKTYTGEILSGELTVSYPQSSGNKPVAVAADGNVYRSNECVIVSNHIQAASYCEKGGYVLQKDDTAKKRNRNTKTSSAVNINYRKKIIKK
jgi:hypothetical protein